MKNLGSLQTIIQKLVRYRDKLLWKLNKKFTEAGKYLHKKFRNKVVNELKSCRINYNNYFTEHKANMKMLWNDIESIINVKGKKSVIFLSWFKMERLWTIHVKLPKYSIITLST